jgi:hypothetical protein
LGIRANIPFLPPFPVLVIVFLSDLKNGGEAILRARQWKKHISESASHCSSGRKQNQHPDLEFESPLAVPDQKRKYRRATPTDSQRTLDGKLIVKALPASEIRLCAFPFLRD